jgi:hypothetical protein
MRDIELKEGGPPDTFDNTLITNYMKCPRAEYWFLRGLDYKRTPSYFVYGRAWGAILNNWHSVENAGRPLEVRKLKALLAGKKAWDSEEVELFENRPNDTWEGLSTMFEYYVESYGEEEPWIQLQPEVGFRFPIPGTLIFYGGSLDAYVEWKPYGVMEREDKSTGAYITPAYMAQWGHVSQITGYIWALQQLVEKPFGILMNVSSKRPRKDSTLRFSRELQTRSEWRTAEFIRETVRIADLIRGEWNNWEWPKWGERNPYSCVGGPGLSPCPYKNLCLQEMPPWELEESYNFEDQFSWRKEAWKPWERKGEE